MAEEDQLDEGEENVENLDGAEGEAGGKSSKKKILLIAVPILLLLAGGAGAYFTGMLDSLLGKSETSEEHADGEDSHGAKDSHGKGDKKGTLGTFLEIPTMIVNLAGDDDGTPRYLRLTVQLELADPSKMAQVEAAIPRVIDQFQTYLRELRVRDLRGSAGIYRLQMELLWRVNQAAHPVEIKDVLFQEILIQ